MPRPCQWCSDAGPCVRHRPATPPTIEKGVRLPHRWPGLPSDGNPDCIAWRCAACGYWVREFESYDEQPGCPIDWRVTSPGVGA